MESKIGEYLSRINSYWVEDLLDKAANKEEIKQLLIKHRTPLVENSKYINEDYIRSVIRGVLINNVDNK